MRDLRMRGGIRRAGRVLAALAAALALAAPAAAQREGERSSGQWRYEYEVSPPELSAGGTALLVLKIQGMSSSSLRLDSLRLSPGLELETQATRPYVMEGGAKGAELRLGFVLKQAGIQWIESLSLASAEGGLSIGPISMKVGESWGSSPRPALWAWIAPASAYRYEAFPIGLERADGGRAATDMRASFKLPADATVEASGYLSWTAVALKEGKLSLPDASIDPARGSSTRRGEADARSVKIKALPKALAASRAIGAFALGLSGPSPERPAAGGTADFILRLEGSGNFPCLILPEPELLLDGAPLGKASWSSKRTDDAKPSASGYTGSASLRVSVAAPRAGKLVLRFPPLPTLRPDGKVRILEVEAIEVEIAAPAAAASQAPAAQAAGRAPAAPEEPSIASESFGPTAREARLLWERGERGAALAALYGTMRGALPFERSYREADEASRAIRAAIDAGEPSLDALPPPRAFAAIAAVALAAAGMVAAAAAARRRRRESSRARRPPAAALVLAAAAIASASLALASALERRDAYAVVWTDRVSVIPSPLAELEIRVPLGSTARLRLEALGFAGLAFADGVEAWAPVESVHPY